MAVTSGWRSVDERLRPGVRRSRREGRALRRRAVHVPIGPAVPRIFDRPLIRGRRHLETLARPVYP
jgi:hypothetical protein